MIGTVTKIPPVVFLLAAAVAVLFAFGDAQSLRGLVRSHGGASDFAVGEGKTVTEPPVEMAGMRNGN